MSIRHKTNKNKYQEDKTDETYRLPNGAEHGQRYQYTTGTNYTQTKREKNYGYKS